MTTAPCGFLAGTSLAALRERRLTPPFDRLWARLERRTRHMAAHALATNFADSFGHLAWHSYTPGLPAAALLHAVTGDPALLEYFEKALHFVDAQSRGRLAENRARAIHSHSEIAIAADVLRDSLSVPVRRQLCAFMREVAIDDNSGPFYIAHGGGGNVAWCHNVQAAVCGLLWGEECGHPRWRQVVRQAIDHTRCYLAYGCDEAGFSYEGTGYGHGVFGVMFPFVELLALNGIADLYQSEPRLRRCAEAVRGQIFPDFHFPLNDNDAGLRGAESLPYLLFLARRFDDAELRGLWHAYQGPEHPLRPYGDMRPWLCPRLGGGDAEAPDAFVPDPYHALFFTFLNWEPDKPATSVHASPLPVTLYSPGTETVNLRTSWGPDAIYLNIQGGGRSRMSVTHRHADAGHFSIFAHGEYLAIDTGRYNSDEDQHSVMIVNGKPHRPVAPGWHMDFLSGRVARYESGELLTHARIDAAHMKGCYWAERDLLWVPLGHDDGYLVTLDNQNKDNSRHTYWWQLQAHPATQIHIDSPWQARIAGERARLDISFTWPGPPDMPAAPHTFTLRQDVKEWHYPYGADPLLEAKHLREGLLNTSFRRPRLVGELDGGSGKLMSVIVPRRAAAAPLAVTRREQQRLLWMEIATPLGTDTVIAAPDHGFIQTAEFRCLTELLFLRHDAAGNRLAAWSLGRAPLEFPAAR